MKKTILSIALTLSLFLAFLVPAHAQPQHKSLTKVHFILNWLPNVEFAGLWVGQDKGWFQKAGIDMSFTPWSPSVHPETDVPQESGINFGFQSGAAIVQARAVGVPIKALYTDTQRSVFGLTVLASSNIHKITDLAGKNIGYQPHELYVPQTMLAYAGVKNWKEVPVSFDTVQLTTKKVDAYLSFLTNEPIALKLAGVKTRSFAASKYGFHFYDDVMFTTDSLIKSDPKLVGTITRIVARGFAYAHTHHVYATKLTTSKYFTAAAGTSASENYKQQLLELTAFDKFSKDRHGKFSGRMDSATWQDSVNTLFKYGETKTKPSVDSLYTNKFNR